MAHLKKWYAVNSDSHFHKKLFTIGCESLFTIDANMQQNISPHKLRHFLFTWLKKKGIDDALIQPYSGHETRQSLEVYSKLSLSEAQDSYDDNIKDFPI